MSEILKISLGKKSEKPNNPQIIFDPKRDKDHWDAKNIGDELEDPAGAKQSNQDEDPEDTLRRLELDIRGQDALIDDLEIEEMQLDAKVAMLKIIMMEPMKKFHEAVKENVDV